MLACIMCLLTTIAELLTFPYRCWQIVLEIWTLGPWKSWKSAWISLSETTGNSVLVYVCVCVCVTFYPSYPVSVA